MIISATDLKKYIECNLTDEAIDFKLAAIESGIRSYTNNNFQNRNIRYIVNVSQNALELPTAYFKVGDTIQISQSKYNNGLYVIKSIKDAITLDGSLFDEEDVLVTKVEYPKDVVMGVINMFDWDLRNRNKVGIQSETISRHSVTYFNLDASNSQLNYPTSLLGFLKPYMKARF